MVAKHQQNGLRLISLCLDESKRDAETALRRSVAQDPVLTKLAALGLKLGDGEGNLQERLLETLRRAGARIDGRAAERAVLQSLSALGADFERLKLLNQGPFAAAFGKESVLHMVPPGQRELYFQALNCGGPPQLFVIDQRGILRMHGYLIEEEEVAKLVDSLLANGGGKDEERPKQTARETNEQGAVGR